jgi:hypothetical protein
VRAIRNTQLTRTDSIAVKQHPDGMWFAEFDPPLDPNWGVWGYADSRLGAIEDLAAALSEMAQVHSRLAAA